MDGAISWLGDHWLDLILAIVLLIFFFMGWKMGLIKGAFSLVGLVGGIWFAGMWAGNLDRALISKWLDGSTAYWVSYLVIILITLLVAYILARYVGKVTQFGFLGSVNTIGGMAVGLLLGAFLAQAVIIAISKVSFMTGGIENSSIVGWIRPVTGWAVNILPDEPEFLKGIKDFLIP
jgi:membrane protein required for colicin V production